MQTTPINIAEGVSGEEGAGLGVQVAVAEVVEVAFRVLFSGGEEVLPREGVRAAGEVVGEEFDGAEGFIGETLFYGAGVVEDRDHVPVGVVVGVEAFVEGFVVVIVAVSEDEVVDVLQAPDELLLRSGGGIDPFFQRLPVGGEVEVAGLVEGVVVVKLFDDAAVGGVVLISGNGLFRVVVFELY